VGASAGGPVASADVLAVGREVPGAGVGPGRVGVRTLAWTRSDGDGSFRLAAPAGSAVFAGAPGMEPAAAGAAGPLLVARLAPASRVEGRVVDASGLPIGGARVRILWISPQPGGYVPYVADRTSDAAGRYAFGAVPPGDRLLLVDGGGWVSVDLVASGDVAESKLRIRVPAEGVLRRDLVVRSGATLSGRVVDEEGKGIAGASVSAGRVPSPSSTAPWADESAVTDGDGSFRLRSLIPGAPFDVYVEWPGGIAAPVQAVGGGSKDAAPVVLVVERAWWLDVHVIEEASGRPARGVVLDLAERKGPALARVFRLVLPSDGSGNMRVGPFGARPIGVRVHRNDRVDEPATYRFVERPRPGASAEVVLRVPAADR